MPNQRARNTLRIGELARASGLSPDALRHYERIGLLPPPPRTSGGFREYPQDTVRRVKVIQRALGIGFTLAELAGIFRERASGRAPCQRVRALAGEKLRALEAKIAELERLRNVLHRTMVAWDARLVGATPGRASGLLESLADSPPELPDGRNRIASASRPPRRTRAR